jgi:hypothetical protein
MTAALILQRFLFTAREKEPHSDTHAPIQPGPNKFERKLAAAGQRRIDAANNGSDTGAEPYVGSLLARGRKVLAVSGAATPRSAPTHGAGRARGTT